MKSGALAPVNVSRTRAVPAGSSARTGVAPLAAGTGPAVTAATVSMAVSAPAAGQRVRGERRQAGRDAIAT